MRGVRGDENHFVSFYHVLWHFSHRPGEKSHLCGTYARTVCIAKEQQCDVSIRLGPKIKRCSRRIGQGEFWFWQRGGSPVHRGKRCPGYPPDERLLRLLSPGPSKDCGSAIPTKGPSLSRTVAASFEPAKDSFFLLNGPLGLRNDLYPPDHSQFVV